MTQLLLELLLPLFGFSHLPVLGICQACFCLRAFALAVSLAFNIISPDVLLAHILTSHEPLLKCCLLSGAFPDFPIYHCTSAPLMQIRSYPSDAPSLLHFAPYPLSCLTSRFAAVSPALRTGLAQNSGAQ